MIRKRLTYYMIDIDINDFDYELPAERIAQYPVAERDASKLLIYKNGIISNDTFKNLGRHLPSDSLLVFNNSRVIRARILFRKESGAAIEVFCLEPVLPDSYELSLGSSETVVWKCIIGNLKKWKNGKIASLFNHAGKEYELTAEKIVAEGDAWQVRFYWNSREITFGEVIESSGHIPLPPYINREDLPEDASRYQTVYSCIKGSVAAPTAGLHFTNDVLAKLTKRGIRSADVTLHVGAGTFQPVKSKFISGHEMHCEHFFADSDTIKLLRGQIGKIIPVGTTSVRTLESLYWLGAKLVNSPNEPGDILSLGQWEVYEKESNVTPEESMEALLSYLKKRKLSILHAITSIIIIPGYKFRMTKGIITNFHQPRSTLLLLICAWTGDDWRKIYRYALEDGFRFLSYGDSSLLL